MGSWYRVTKRINGRLYHYWQRTYRAGKSVKTENKYIGPVANCSVSAPSTYSTTAPTTPEDVMVQYFSPNAPDERERGNIRKLNGEKKAILRNEAYFNADAFDRVQDELDYAYAVKRDTEKRREAKRKTKGIKAANPFMAQALVKKP
jgi:hypothetical protein